ncbi:MAG: hypothetical protein AB7S26_31475 [Sandaracinaceae bacterium]
MDAARFPRLAHYLDLLPEGIHSYPECRSKGVLFRSAIDGHDLGDVIDRLPSELRDVILSPPPAGVWMPAVHCDAAFHAVCDRFYPTDQAIRDWSGARTRTTAKNRVYQRVMRAAGPAMFLRLAEPVHNRMFQRGTVVRITIEGSQARLVLTHPPHLHITSKHATNVPMLRSLLERVGGEDVDVEMRESGPDGALFVASWRA